MKILKYIVLISILITTLNSCIEDGFTTSPSDQPQFSADTLKMGLLFTEEGSPTSRFTVYNRASKGISISDIVLEGDGAPMFRLNVDGLSGKQFHNVEIRANDSIFVMVDALIPESGKTLPVDVEAKVRFRTNGVDRTVVLTASGQDVNRLHALTIKENTTLSDGKPYQIFDSLVVAPNTTLTIDPGSRLYFHDGAYMRVYGTLVSNGTQEKPVDMTGDRTGNVVGDISFDIMSRQWGGIIIMPTARDCRMTHTDMRNTWFGLIVDGDGSTNLEKPALTLLNSRLHNSAELVLDIRHAAMQAAGCEFAEGGYGLVSLGGGQHRIDQCTFANNYLFTAISGPALQLNHLNSESDDESGLPHTSALITNSILYGLGSDISHGVLDDTDITLDHCLLRSEGNDDDHFIACIWNEDPLYYTIREDYVFDYRLKTDSPARGASDPTKNLPESRTDAYGTIRNGALGAYETAGPEEAE